MSRTAASCCSCFGFRRRSQRLAQVGSPHSSQGLNSQSCCTHLGMHVQESLHLSILAYVPVQPMESVPLKKAPTGLCSRSCNVRCFVPVSDPQCAVQPCGRDQWDHAQNKLFLQGLSQLPIFMEASATGIAPLPAVVGHLIDLPVSPTLTAALGTFAPFRPHAPPAVYARFQTAPRCVARFSLRQCICARLAAIVRQWAENLARSNRLTTVTCR